MNSLYGQGFSYSGAKWSQAHRIVNLLPPGDLMLDVFAGSCSLSIAAARAGFYKQVVANDRSKRVVRMLLTLRDRRDELIQRLAETPCARETYERSLGQLDHEDDLVAACACFYVMQLGPRYLPSSKVVGWRRPTIHPVNSSVSHGNAEWRGVVDRLEALALDFQSIVLENRDWADAVEKYEPHRKGIVVYVCDPPYLDTKDRYEEAHDFDQGAFYEWANGCKHPVLVLDRANANPPLEGFAPMPLPKGNTTGKAPALDVAWINYQPPGGLFPP